VAGAAARAVHTAGTAVGGVPPHCTNIRRPVWTESCWDIERE
jgi:hypothetical protein